jgi:hypothetical protein
MCSITWSIVNCPEIIPPVIVNGTLLDEPDDVTLNDDEICDILILSSEYFDDNKVWCAAFLYLKGIFSKYANLFLDCIQMRPLRVAEHRVHTALQIRTSMHAVLSSSRYLFRLLFFHSLLSSYPILQVRSICCNSINEFIMFFP